MNENRIHSPLEGFDSESGRCKGNTTRLADRAIQIFFEEGAVKIRDHHKDGKCDQSNKHLFEKVKQRLQVEHRCNFRCDKKSLIISQNSINYERTRMEE